MKHEIVGLVAYQNDLFVERIAPLLIGIFVRNRLN